MPAKQPDQEPIDSTDSEGGETDIAVATKEPSPLDRALMSTRHAHPQATSLWMQGDSVVAVVPMAFMPGNITAAPTYSEEHATAVEPAVVALTALQAATQAVLDVRAASQSDPTLTEAAAILNVANAYDKLVPAATKKLDAARANVEAQIKAAEASLAAPVTQGATGPFAAELRAVVRAMEPGERLAALSQAIKDGDAALAGAVLGAHPMLSGLNAQAVQALTAQWQKGRNPAQVQKLELLSHTRDAIDRAGQQLMRNMDGIHGARLSTITKLRTATGKAQRVIGAVLPVAA